MCCQCVLQSAQRVLAACVLANESERDGGFASTCSLSAASLDAAHNQATTTLHCEKRAQRDTRTIAARRRRSSLLLSADGRHHHGRASRSRLDHARLLQHSRQRTCARRQLTRLWTKHRCRCVPRLDRGAKYDLAKACKARARPRDEPCHAVRSAEVSQQLLARTHRQLSAQELCEKAPAPYTRHDPPRRRRCRAIQPARSVAASEAHSRTSLCFSLSATAPTAAM